jgi:hypothetical protein
MHKRLALKLSNIDCPLFGIGMTKEDFLASRLKNFLLLL